MRKINSHGICAHLYATIIPSVGLKEIKNTRFNIVALQTKRINFYEKLRTRAQPIRITCSHTYVINES